MAHQTQCHCQSTAIQSKIEEDKNLLVTSRGKDLRGLVISMHFNIKYEVKRLREK